MYQKIERLLKNVQKPSRYTGGELNMVVKDPKDVDTRFAFCFPDTYEVGMSHLGIKILYHILNDEKNVYCERVFTPWVDMEAAMRENDIPLYGLETFTPLCDFDIVGFTLQYEMSYSNIIGMMDLGRIAPFAADRGEDEPIVVMGGPCAFNPEPLADIADVFLIGDGEESILDFVRTYRRCREQGLSREQLLFEMTKIQGAYVPRFYEARFDEGGEFQAVVPLRSDVPASIVKRLVPDLDGAAFPDSLIVPFTDIVFDRVMLEVARGCTRGCRFCQAGVLYRPQRERKLETLVAQAQALIDATGYEEISLSSLSTGDYSCLPDLVRKLIADHGGEKVSISLPSLRIDSVLGETLEETKSVRKTGLTFAPEAGSQRMRDVINKGVTEENLLSSVYDAFEKGWSGVKLYFMIGLPTETSEDLAGIAELGAKVKAQYYKVPKEQRQKGLRVTCSASSFVPKPFTPFQWYPQNTTRELIEKQQYLKDLFKGLKGVDFNWHAPYLSAMEAAFSRGDRRLGRVIVQAYRLGCRFDGWSDHFSFDKWVEAFKLEGLSYEQFAYKAFDLDAPLPWDHIDCGVTKAFLQREYKKALTGDLSPDCRAGCHGCGIRQAFGEVCNTCG